MCGRFSVYGEISDLKLNLSIQVELLFRPWTPKYNISPTAGPGYEQLIAVTERDGHRSLRLARWWFIPPRWSKPLRELPTAFNARSEDLVTRPLWRGAIGTSRCLVPATGWREFKPVSRGKKQPYHFHFENNEPFAFAGLRSVWHSPGGAVDTFAIITGEANEVVNPIHDRMPLVVPADLYSDWLNTDDPLKVLNEIQQRSRQLSLFVIPTDPVANDSKFEGSEAIRRVDLVHSRVTEEPVQQNLFDEVLDHRVLRR